MRLIYRWQQIALKSSIYLKAMKVSTGILFSAHPVESIEQTRLMQKLKIAEFSDLYILVKIPHFWVFLNTSQFLQRHLEKMSNIIFEGMNLFRHENCMLSNNYPTCIVDFGFIRQVRAKVDN
uniref:Protein kinase domain-containing protein n=1 Tax=Romanomermis culicivorax TaxID=13658 RepID=A0A915J0M0_ROMCU